ncbi:MAG TPA: hypothetical protein VJB70_00115 [Candidatus Paceibacterota bacterium]
MVLEGEMQKEEWFTAKVIENLRKGSHYYGDIVRRLFFIEGVVILLALPLYLHIITFPIFYIIGLAVLLILAAGTASPAQHWTSSLNLLLSMVGLVAFEWFALSVYQDSSHSDFHRTLCFWLNHFLALGFAVALYFSVKTARWQFLGKHISEE